MKKKTVLVALFTVLITFISCRNEKQDVEGTSNTVEGVGDARREGMEQEREWEQLGVQESQDSLERDWDTAQN
jgi:hypothetical protein